uniref:Papilin n=1 Tax=Timema cristinae TaxID=61476 RepID=A0A7R9CYH2_TIMCR|nr:unnamed protein product [Timema cristinae]
MDTTLGLGEMGATPLFSVGGTDVSSDTSEISGMASELSSLSTQGSVGSSGLTSSASTDSSSLLTDFITPSSLDTATISQDVMLSDSTDVSSDSPLSSLSSDGIKLTELSSTSLSEEISSSLSSDLSATPGTTMSDYVNSTESSLSSLSDITSSSDIDSTFLSSDTSPASSGSLSTDSSSNGETLSTSSTDSLSSSSGSGSPKTDTTLSGGSSVSLNYSSSDLSSSSDGVSPQTDTTSSDSSSTSDTSSSSTSDTSSSSDDTSPPTIDTTSSSDSSSVSETIEGSGMTTGSLDVDELLTTLITGSGMSSLETKPSPDTDFVVEADFDESEGSGDLEAVSTPAAMSPSEISEGSTLFSQDTSTDSATESSSIFSTDIYSTLFTTLSSVFTTSSSEESTVYSTTESSTTEMFTESSYSESSSYESSSSESSSSEISSTEASSEISTVITTESIDLTSTESSSEISTSTDTTEYSTVGSTDVTSTEVSGSSAGGDGSTVSGDDEKEEVTTPSPAQVAVTNEQKERKCRRRKKPVQEPEVVKCEDSKFGCCSDGITEAQGPFNKGCPQPTTCSETEFKCCSDGVSPAEGPNEEGCPPSLCKETLFGCCPDGVNIAEGNDFEGCEEDMMPFLCNKTEVNLLNRFGCCPDGLVAATGPDNEGCFTCEGSGECESCNDTKFGCCPDGLRAASGDNFTGCEQPEEGSGEGFLPVTKEPEPEVDCAESEHGCCPDGLTVATGPNFDGCGVIDTDNCTLSYFRCCPDGSTPALGPQYEGCRMPCEDEVYGCCADRVTPAHGPSQEGCCLNTPYGCCPDNILPAQGANLEELYSHQAVAASTVPIAAVLTMLRQLEDLTMRGAAVSTLLMGVVPMVTPLQRGPASRDVHAIPSNLDAVLMGSPSHEGLKTKVDFVRRFCCHQRNMHQLHDAYKEMLMMYIYNSLKIFYEIAVLEDGFGDRCGCENTQFGCCSDDRTPASGSELEGCGCEASKFGCCPDGVVEAQGDKFEGCDDVPLIAAEACFLPKIEGPCEGYYPTWHYDAERKQCRQFIYGGCLGNNNKFQTREECDELCVTPDTIDACDQPKFEGPCRGNFSRWYFDKESGICSEFSYGGCKGNGNNFYTESACHQQCLQPGRSRVMDVCALPKDMGPCPGAILRWHYDAIQQTCKQFVYGGCQGNGNRFRTEEDCRTKCHVSATTRDHCALPRAQGNCTERLPRWFFDAEENRCMPFYYTGCEGNANRFETQEACETDCPPKVEQDTCTLPAMVGECHNYTERWYYDSFEVRCRPFYYGGCGGNHNNFHNMQDCQQRCEAGYNTPEPPEQFKTEYCFLPDDHGPCSESVAHWFYDSRDGVCKQFLYGGCQGNQNRFASRQDCEQSCGNVQDKCILPRVVGPCSGSIQQWYYEQRSNNCEEFDYGGCQGNANRFNDRQECEESCKRGVPEITTAGPRILEPKTDNSLSVVSSMADACLLVQVYGEFQPVDICLTHVDPGPCRGQNSAWYFDYSSLSCQAFVYGGCGGNANRFESEEQCERQCGIFKGQDVCTIPYEIGPCRGLFRKWYFDSTSGHCQEFDYGGCSGNGNRFSSISECESICLHREELLPTGDDTSLSHQGATLAIDWTSDDGEIKAGKALLTLYSPPTTNKPKTFPTWFLVAVCRLPVETGPCEGGYYKRWYFNQDHRTCIPFIYSGCAGNLNRFKNFQTCLNFCSVMLQEGGSGEPDDTQGQRKCTERVVSDGLSVLSTAHFKLLRTAIKETNKKKTKLTDHKEAKKRKILIIESSSESDGDQFTVRNSEDKDEDYNSFITGIGLQTTEKLDVDIWAIVKFMDKRSVNYFVANEIDVDSPREKADGLCAEAREECNKLHCPYRVEKFVDSSDCERCRCHDPCRDQYCPEDTLCAVDLYHNDETSRTEFRAICRQANEIDVDSPREKADGLCAEAREECNKLHCPYRVEKFVDSSDCERCRCHDPCRDQYCPEDTLCAVDLYHNDETSRTEFRAICRQVNKPGVCPRLTPITGNCIEECTTDADCVEDFKCCFNGCGSSCVHSLAPEAQILTTFPSTSQPTEAQTQTLARGEVPPSIVDTEPVLTAEEGSQATLRCIATGSPTPSISWRKDRLTHHVLLLIWVICLCTNDSNGFRDEDGYNVPPFACTESGKTSLSTSDQDLNLDILVIGSLITGSNGRTKILLDGSLQIIGLQRSDAGVYICFADNGVGQPSYKEITLDITEPTSRPAEVIGEDSTYVVVALGAPTVLQCYAIGWPRPSVTWWRGDRMLPFSSELFEQRRDYSLLIHSVTLRNLGPYTCQAYNGLGRAASWTVTVQAVGPVYSENPEDVEYTKYLVHPPQRPETPIVTAPERPTYPYRPARPPQPETPRPRPPPPLPVPETTPIPTQPQVQPDSPPETPRVYIVPVQANVSMSQTVFPVGSDISIPCDVDGYPIPRVTWYKDGQPLQSEDRLQISESHRLLIIRSNSNDTGEYRCEAFNQYGTSTSSTTITVEGVYIHPNCTDNPFFANCRLIVQAQYCTHRYYARFCCKSCTLAGQLPSHGAHLEKSGSTQ